MVVDIGTVLLQWQNAGIFDFLLPFLLVFSIVFGILSATRLIGGNKGLHVIIAVVIGLMSIGYSYSTGFGLSQFLQVLFPKLAIGVSIILTLLILIGLFIPKDEMRYWGWGLGAIGVIIAIVIIAQTFEKYGWYSSGYYSDYAGWVIGAVLLLGLIIAVASSGGSGGSSGSDSKKGDVTYVPVRSKDD